MIFVIVLFSAVLYVAMMNPGKSRKHKILEVTCFAHRGMHDIDGVPENSMMAFRRAKELGYGIELDVQLTKDGVLVVHHDYDLKRTCGVNQYIKDLTYQELFQFKLMGTQERIPRFVDVLHEIDGSVPLLIELKMETFHTKLCQMTAQVLDQYKGLYCMESFHPYALYWFKKYRPEVIRGQLSEQYLKEKETKNILSYVIMQNLLTNFITKPDFIAYKYKYKDCLPLKICRNFYHVPIYGWTFRSEKAYKRYIHDFHGFIFERFML